MKICTKCILPETYPGISFDENGVCNFCNEHEKKENQIKSRFQNKDQLKDALEKYKNINKKYDVLVPLSGGVDSAYTLINMIKEYNLRPLAYHNDNGYENEIAVKNAKELCKALDVDLIITQQKSSFMKKTWKYLHESKVYGVPTCYVCANIIFINAVEIAKKYGIKLVVNGYTKGQAQVMKDNILGVNMLKAMRKITRAKGEGEFYQEFIDKFEQLSNVITYSEKEDLEKAVDLEKTLVIPFYIFKFYKTDKEMLKKEIRKIFNWKDIPYSFPAKTTNCRMNWLNTYVDRKKIGYCSYDIEFAELVRNGEITREQALEDLKLNLSTRTIEELANEVGTDLNLIEPLTKE
ncbi:7-cyano-7-deazaguanine synthase [uncultured Clostridium sp.]|uniref:7-cyano-7-deazaguanine synthase n=1 Tax=uncultured Clostridium sp. TaxID=59620 RepID=UPI0025FAD47A|nr:7-cyano-7-deazaguanine synthase [uncultured Clostridium sp.]